MKQKRSHLASKNYFHFPRKLKIHHSNPHKIVIIIIIILNFGNVFELIIMSTPLSLPTTSKQEWRKLSAFKYNFTNNFAFKIAETKLG